MDKVRVEGVKVNARLNAGYGGKGVRWGATCKGLNLGMGGKVM